EEPVAQAVLSADPLPAIAWTGRHLDLGEQSDLHWCHGHSSQPASTHGAQSTLASSWRPASLSRPSHLRRYASASSSVGAHWGDSLRSRTAASTMSSLVALPLPVAAFLRVAGATVTYGIE